MKAVPKSYLVILGHIVLGLIVLILIQLLPLPKWVNSSVLLFAVFLLVNLVDTNVFNLKGELKEYWTLKKLHYLIIGILGGATIAFIPTLIALVTKHIRIEEISINTDLTITSALVTFLIVAWEELWFRGLFLNYCKKHLSTIHISLVIGALFMLIHLFNPDINMLKTGPALFFAGATLTLLYFYYKSIWLPLGLHFGNNYWSTMVKTETDGSLIFENDGYLSALILLGLFLIYVIKIKKAALTKVNAS